jgi:hypothetical protein
MTERDPKQGLLVTGGWISAFLVFMAFYAGLQNALRVADQNYSVAGISHNEEKLKDLENKIMNLRDYVDAIAVENRRLMFTKDEHLIFDRERSATQQEVENRMVWLEHQCGKK